VVDKAMGDRCARAVREARFNVRERADRSKKRRRKSFVLVAHRQAFVYFANLKSREFASTVFSSVLLPQKSKNNGNQKRISMLKDHTTTAKPLS
jgi:hypothetical protein